MPRLVSGPLGSFLPALVLSVTTLAIPSLMVLARAAEPPSAHARSTRAVEAPGEPSGRLIVALVATAEEPTELAPDVRVRSLAYRTGVPLRLGHTLLPSMHVVHLLLPQAGTTLQTTLRTLAADPAVRFVEVDRRVRVAAAPNDPLYTGTPGVPGASGQWYLQAPVTTPDGPTAAALDVATAWSTTTGSASLVLADIDTGVRFDHPDLGRAASGGRLLPGYDFVSGDSDGGFATANDGDGWDADPSDPGDWIDAADQSKAVFKSCAIEPSSWHGTKVAGFLAAATNNVTGIAGITWQGHVAPVRALGKCGGYESDVIAGLTWAAGLAVSGAPGNPYPAHVINLSLGVAGACSSSMATATAAVLAAGIPIIAAAGNDSSVPTSPANCPGVIDVIGLEHDGSKAAYSNFLTAGTGVAATSPTVAAPGGDCGSSGTACLFTLVTTTNLGSSVPAANGYTDQANAAIGTSYASALTAGVVGLMRSVNAALSPAQIAARLTEQAPAYPAVTGETCGPHQTGRCDCTVAACGAPVRASSAVAAARRPIAALTVSGSATSGGPLSLEAQGSAAACGHTLRSYTWTATQGGQPVNLANPGASQQSVSVTATPVTLTLTVTDDSGQSDTLSVVASTAGVTITNPSAGAGVPVPANVSQAACLDATGGGSTDPIVAANPLNSGGHGGGGAVDGLTLAALAVLGWRRDRRASRRP